jgi:hypothetical protein
MPYDGTRFTNLKRDKYETRPMETYLHGPKWSLNLLESHIRYAMANTSNNMAAARFLKVSSHTYKRYAKKYIDEKTGISLYEMHKNQHDGSSQTTRTNKQIVSNLGKRTKYIPLWKVKRSLLRNKIFEEKCQVCGYAEKRLIDGKVPLALHFKDPGVEFPYDIKNLHLICFNCSYQVYGSEIHMHLKRPKFNMEDGTIIYEGPSKK